MITFQSIEQMLEAASESGLPLWEEDVVCLEEVLAD